MTVFSLFAAGSKHGVRYVSEATFGIVPPTPAMVSLRHTGCSLILSKDTFQSAELRSDRQIADFRHGTHKVAGDINVEMSYAEFDPFIKSAFCGTFQTYTAALNSKTGNISVTLTGGSKFLAAIQTFTSFGVGSIIKYGGSVTNAGYYVLSAVAPHTLTVMGALTAQTAATSRTIRLQPAITNGTANYSLTIERAHTDITQYQQFRGCVVDKFTLGLKPSGIVTGVFSVIGKAATITVTPLKAVPTVSQTGSPYDTFSGTLREGGTLIATITSIDFSLENGGEATYVIGSKYASNVVLGRCNITGTIEAYFSSVLLLNKFINETETSIEVDIGGSSNFYKLFLPRVKYGGGDTGVTGEGPIMMKMPFQALYSSTYGFTVRMAKMVT